MFHLQPEVLLAEAHCTQETGSISSAAKDSLSEPVIDWQLSSFLVLPQTAFLHLLPFLLAGPLRRHPSRNLPMGLLRFQCPHAARCTPSRSKNLFWLHRFLWTFLFLFRGWALWRFSSFAASTRPAPSKVSTARATCCWWSPSLRFAHSSSANDTNDHRHILLRHVMCSGP